MGLGRPTSGGTAGSINPCSGTNSLRGPLAGYRRAPNENCADAPFFTFPGRSTPSCLLLLPELTRHWTGDSLKNSNGLRIVSLPNYLNRDPNRKLYLLSALPDRK